MIERRYRAPFLAALVVNIVFWGSIGYWAQTLEPPETRQKDLIVDLTMNTVESTDKQQNQEQLVEPSNNTEAGGKTGAILPDLSGKPIQGLKELNPYLGGNETASVNLKGNGGNLTGVPGSGNIPGSGGGSQGNGGLGEDGDGSLGGKEGDALRAGTGSYDSSGYIERVEANKVMPQQAIRRGITGIVSFNVTFDENGNFSDAELIGSSGSSILDNAATELVSSQGGIENTTGQPVTIVVNVTYAFN